MNRFNEAFEKELQLQERKSNRHSIAGFSVFLFAAALIWLLAVTGIFTIEVSTANIVFVITVIGLIPPLVLQFTTNLSNPYIKYYFLALSCILCSVLAAIMSFHASFLYIMPLLLTIQYRRKSLLWFTYIINAVCMLFSMIFSFYYGLCDLNLLFASQHNREWYLNVLEVQHGTIPYNENPLFVIIVFAVFPRCILLAAFTLIMQYSFVSLNEDVLRFAQLTYLEETDASTQVYNKNKYQQMIKEYYPKISQIAVVFFDINNLKIINDEHGHLIGDKAILTMASYLNEYANIQRRIYRIGGDEFMMIIDSPTTGEAEQIASEISKASAKEVITEDIPFSFSYGIAYGKGSNIMTVIKEADHKMYEYKRAHK